MNIEFDGMHLIVIFILLSLNVVSLIYQQYYDYFVTSKHILVMFEMYLLYMLFMLYALI